MKLRQLSALLVALSLPFVAHNTYAADHLAKHLYTVERPKPIKRVQPKYPSSALKQHREGWAVVSFVIDEQGDVSDVVLSKDSGSKDFAEASVEAVKKWKYEPRVENGKPVQQCANNVLLDFKLGEGGQKGITRKFRKHYKKAQAALMKKQFAEVEENLAAIERIEEQHLSENTYYHLLAAKYAKARGDKRSQLNHLETIVTGSLDNLVNEKQKLSVLSQIFELQITRQRYNSANRTYHRLKKLPAAQPYLARFAEQLRVVNDFIAGDQYLTYDAQIKKNSLWQVNLVRKKFSLTNVQGDLSKLELRCANKHHAYSATEGSSWEIPESWNKCSLYVFGKPGASFKVTEHPFSS